MLLSIRKLCGIRSDAVFVAVKVVNETNLAESRQALISLSGDGEPLAKLSPITSSTAGGANLIDQPLARPIKIPGFKPLARVEVYER